MWSYNTGACGWCSNFQGTNTGKCLYYTSSTPSQCSSSSSFTYNTGYTYDGAAVAAAVGLFGAVLIIVIVAPLVICVCIIGCSVYFCCIRPKNQTTVVVAGGPAYQPMAQGQTQYAQPGYPPQQYPPQQQQQYPPQQQQQYPAYPSPQQ
jgi:hypothetical protein